LHKLERLSAELKGPNIWLKRDDLTGCLLSGNKVRKLEFIAAHAQAQNKNVLITCGGLQSNHARATAFVGSQLGIPVHLVLRGLPTDIKQIDLDANLLLDHLAGAKVDYYEKHYYQQNLQKYSAQQHSYINNRDISLILFQPVPVMVLEYGATLPPVKN
jgi:D-cysteine desulfhydrase